MNPAGTISSCTGDLSIAVILTFLLSVTLCIAILLVVCAIFRAHYSIIKMLVITRHLANFVISWTCSSSGGKVETVQQAVYEEVDTNL